MKAYLTKSPVIETERLTLRAPRIGDYPAWEAFYASERAAYIGGPGGPGPAWRALCHAAGMWVFLGFGSFVFCRRDDETPLGMTGPWHPADWPERELGWTVWAADVEGTGLAFEAACAARDYAFGTLNWATAVSYIDPANARSVALAERMGATLDDDAARPLSEGKPAPLVYRHPRPEGL